MPGATRTHVAVPVRLSVPCLCACAPRAVAPAPRAYAPSLPRPVRLRVPVCACAPCACAPCAPVPVRPVSPVPVRPVLGCDCVLACDPCTWFGCSQDTITNCRISAQMCRHNALGCLLGTLVLAMQVVPARAAYGCTSAADCAYKGCNDVSCACSSSSSNCINGFWTGYSECQNGVWDAICVSTTFISTKNQAETALFSHFPVSLYYVAFWRLKTDFWDFWLA